MFCPKCATQNVDGASYCRVCGANISLVPQALTGQLPAVQPDEDRYSWESRRRRRRGGPSTEEAVRSLMMGVAFAAISIIVSKAAPGGGAWWFWLLIPAAACFAKGFSNIIRLQGNKSAQITQGQVLTNSVRQFENPGVPQTAELRAPVPSVTEGTTRHLGAEAATKHIDSFDSQKPS
jgi:zinc-ribbon domain